MNKLIIFIILTIILMNCKDIDKCNEKYVIQGRIINATTGKWWIGLPLKFYAYDKKKDKTLGNIGYSLTDSMGFFKLEYNCSDLYADQINLSSDVGEYWGLGFNQNVNQEIYFSSASSIKVNFKSSTPLVLDTLFLSSWQGSSVLLDTIINQPLEFSKMYRFSNSKVRFVWGRGHKEFVYLPSVKDVLRFKDLRDIYPKGDPYIDSFTLNY